MPRSKEKPVIGVFTLLKIVTTWNETTNHQLQIILKKQNGHHANGNQLEGSYFGYGHLGIYFRFPNWSQSYFHAERRIRFHLDNAFCIQWKSSLYIGLLTLLKIFIMKWSEISEYFKTCCPYLSIPHLCIFFVTSTSQLWSSSLNCYQLVLKT